MNEGLSTAILKVDQSGRIRTPLEKRQQIVAGYEKSGMTGKQFAEFCGVRYSTLMTWVKRHGKQRSDGGKEQQARCGWVEALIEEPQEAVLDLTVGDTVRMRVGSVRQAELAGAVLRGMGMRGSC